MAFVCAKSPEEEKTLENPDLEDGEIEDDDDDDELPTQPTSTSTTTTTQDVEKSPEIEGIQPAAIPTDVNLFNIENKDSKTKRHPDKKSKSHLTEAEKCVRMLHKIEREARERRERDRRREQLSDDWAGNVEKAIASVLKKPDKQSSECDESGGPGGPGGPGGEEEKKRGRKRKKKERDRKKKHRKADPSPKEEIDENEMLNVRGGSPTPETKETSPFGPGDPDPYDSYDSEYDSETTYITRQNKRSFERERKRERNRNREQRRERKNFREKNNRKKKDDMSQQQQQDANSLCMFYMQGKCHKGDDCPYSHDALPPMKLELCKFYLMDCCAKRDKCLYMHSEFPCKYYHTGLKCLAKENCKFAHGKPLSDALKQVLLKHLETAPKEILGEFPRLSREGAQHMVNQTQHNLELQFGIKQPVPAATPDKTNIPSLFDINVPMPLELMQTPDNPESSEKKNDGAPAPQKEKKVRQTRWNDGPAIPVPPNILLNPVFVGGAPPPPITGLNLQDQQKLQEYQMNYQIKGFYSEQDQDMRINSNGDVDMRTLQPQPQPQPQSQPQLQQMSFEKYSQDAKLTSTLVAPTTTEQPEEVPIITTNVEIPEIPEVETSTSTTTTTTIKNEEIPNLPKKQRELFLRIQAQQKENPPEKEEDVEENIPNDDDWYSSDDENDPLAKMVIHLEDEEPDPDDPVAPAPVAPVEVIDKLGDLSKIDISQEVTKLLQTMQGNATAPKPEIKKSRDPRQIIKQTDPEITSPKSCGASDPRSRVEHRRVSSSQRITIYEQGIINIEEKIQVEKLGIKIQGDVDLRKTEDFGDTDLRQQTGRQDVDLRQLGLPFKGMQNYTPASEIDASVASHSPMTYKVHVCDIPRPDYTGLRLSPKDAETSADPRLKKIFRVPPPPPTPPVVAVINEKDSPASPKCVSPKPTRQDPRRRPPPQDVDTKEPPNLTYQQQLQLLQNSAFYQSLTSNQKVMLNQEIASKGQEKSPQSDPILSGILSSLGLIPSLPQCAPAVNILNNVNSMVPPLSGLSGGMLHPHHHQQHQQQQQQQHLQNIVPNLGPGLLGAAPEFPINFDPRNGGLLGQAPPFQNFNDNFNDNNFQQYNNDEFYPNEPPNQGGPPGPGGNFNPRDRGNFRGPDRGGNRRGGRNWNNRHNNRNYNNRNINRNRTTNNRSYTPP